MEQFVGKLVSAVGDVLEERRYLCWLLLIGLYVPLVLVEAHSSLLSNDEIYTVHIAQAPTISHMLWMTREIDLHPPLNYFLQRGALHLPLPRWCASRLPNMLAGLFASLGIFTYMARRLGNLLGLSAVTIFWSSTVINFAWSNRPYMLWICFLVLLLLAWEAATAPRRTRLAVFAVFACSALMISTHLFGIACLLPFALAECVRYWQRRKLDIWLWLALLSPASIGPLFYYQLQHLASNSFPTDHLPSLSLARNMYVALVTAFYFFLTTSAVISRYLPEAHKSDTSRPMRLKTDEGVLLFSLLLLPLLLLSVDAVLRVQFWERYGACAIVGIALLAPWNLYRRVQAAYTIATVIVFFLIGNTIATIVNDYPMQGSQSEGLHQQGRQPIYLSQLDAALPIVTASPMTFTEMSDRETLPVASRVYYLTDRAAAIRYSGYTLFENEDKISGILGLPSHTAPLGDFLATHPRFYLVASYYSTYDWLPRALVDRGENLQYLGKFVSSYADDDLYLVTVPAAQPTTQSLASLR